MTNGINKLKKDLDILKAMVEELTNYLSSEVLYWPMFKANYPKMTLGGILCASDGCSAYRICSAIQIK
jgi:hypothetical protein